MRLFGELYDLQAKNRVSKLAAEPLWLRNKRAIGYHHGAGQVKNRSLMHLLVAKACCIEIMIMPVASVAKKRSFRIFMTFEVD